MPARSVAGPSSPAARWRDWLAALAVVGACKLLSELLAPYLDLADQVMLYLAGVVYVALRHGLAPSAATVVASIFLFVFRQASRRSEKPMNASVQGPAFPMLVKVLATALVAALLAWGIRVQDALAAVPWHAGALGFLVVAVALILTCYFWILRSRTGITSTHINQTWVWPKRVALADVAHVKLVAVPGLDWLIAPRVIVRTRSGAIVVFHAADRRLLQAFAELSLASVARR